MCPLQLKADGPHLRNYPLMATDDTVAVSCGYDTHFAVKACDGLCHLTKTMDRVGAPPGFQSIVSTYVPTLTVHLSGSVSGSP